MCITGVFSFNNGKHINVEKNRKNVSNMQNKIYF